MISNVIINFEALSSVLSSLERDALSRVLVDGQTQHAIADATNTHRATIQSRIHVAARKLKKTLGVDVTGKLPKRGRPRVRHHLARLDARALDALTVDSDADGLHHGRWESRRKG